jgi:hypothetical protein
VPSVAPGQDERTPGPRVEDQAKMDRSFGGAKHGTCALMWSWRADRIGCAHPCRSAPPSERRSSPNRKRKAGEILRSAGVNTPEHLERAHPERIKTFAQRVEMESPAPWQRWKAISPNTSCRDSERARGIH